MSNIFKYHEIDAILHLPINWKNAIFSVAYEYAEHILTPSYSVQSREGNIHKELESFVVDGNIIRKELPWLYDFYRDTCRNIYHEITGETIVIAKNDLYAINLNIQIGEIMRYECHVDSNPIQGIFYVTDHPQGKGGELVISTLSNVIGIEETAHDAIRIYPKSGYLLFFDGRNNPHFVEPLKENSIRIAVTMNFYTLESPETNRPIDYDEYYSRKTGKKLYSYFPLLLGDMPYNGENKTSS